MVHLDERVLAYQQTRPFWQVHLVSVPRGYIPSFTAAGPEDEKDLRALLAVMQRLARELEETHVAAAVLTNLGAYQDSKHLHVHIRSGPRL